VLSCRFIRTFIAELTEKVVTEIYAKRLSDKQPKILIMDAGTLAVLIPIVGIVFGNALAFGIIYFAIVTRNRERMALIEKGATAEEIYQSRKLSKYSALKNGLFLIGIAVGLIVAAIVSATTALDPVTVYFAFILLFGGLGLVIFYLIYTKNERNQPGSDF
jgi:predicted MFS family arabinose efflux permease